MPKHNPEKPGKVLSKADKARMKNLEEFQDMSVESFKYIRECLTAVIPCGYCSVKEDGKVLAPKYDANHNCAKCHGTNFLPDRETRKWANEMVQGRITPAPKAVEMEVDDKRDVDEWAEQMKDASDDALKDLATKLGVTFDEPGQNSGT